MSKEIITIIKKELKRVFSDRRLVFTTFLLPAISIALIYSVMGIMINNTVTDIEAHKSVVAIINEPVSLEENIDFSTRNIELHKEIEIDEKRVTELLLTKKYDVIVHFEKNFDKKIIDLTTEIPFVLVHRNKSEEYSNEAYAKINEILEEFRYELLLNRVDEENFIKVFSLDKTKEFDIADNKKLGYQGIGMIFPMLISIFLFSGAMSIGIDSIAGEKERGTMSTLLVTPVKRTDIIIGKLSSLSLLAIMSTFSSIIGIILSLPFSRFLFNQSDAEITNAFSGFTTIDGIMVFIVMVSLAGLYVAIITAVSMYAKTIKEAGTYMAPVYMVIMMMAFVNMLSSGTIKIWEFAIPIYGNIIALKTIFLGGLTLIHLLITLLSSTFVIILLILLINKMFSNESIIFPN